MKKQKFFQVYLEDIEAMTASSKVCNFAALQLLSQFRNQYEYAKKKNMLIDGFMIVSYNDYENIGISNHTAKRATTFLVKHGLLTKALYHRDLYGNRGTFLGVKPAIDLELKYYDTSTESYTSSKQLRPGVSTKQPQSLEQNSPNKVQEVQDNLKTIQESSTGVTTSVNCGSDAKVDDYEPKAFKEVEETFVYTAKEFGKTLRPGFMKNFKTRLYPKILKHTLDKVIIHLKHYVSNASGNKKLEHPNLSVDSFSHWYDDIAKDYRDMLLGGFVNPAILDPSDIFRENESDYVKDERMRLLNLRLDCSNWYGSEPDGV